MPPPQFFRALIYMLQASVGRVTAQSLLKEKGQRDTQKHYK